MAKWHSRIGDSTLAEGILDRIIHRAHSVELRGESIRKNPPQGTCVVKRRSGGHRVLKGRASDASPSPGPHPGFDMECGVNAM